MASAALLGLAGTPHCLAMCGATCGALTADGSWATRGAFHVMRLLSYALAGAVVAASIGTLSQWGQGTAAVRPLWTLLHAAAFVLGGWLLWHGRQPAWMERIGRGTTRAADPTESWHVMRGPLRAGGAGALWAAWPCGLLQSALLVAALANTAAGGAAVMSAFALATGAALALGPWLFARLTGAGTPARASVWTTRLAGLVLAIASAWALATGTPGSPFCTTH